MKLALAVFVKQLPPFCCKTVLHSGHEAQTTKSGITHTSLYPKTDKASTEASKNVSKQQLLQQYFKHSLLVLLANTSQPIM